jgi:hypothetical protein
MRLSPTVPLVTMLAAAGPAAAAPQQPASPPQAPPPEAGAAAPDTGAASPCAVPEARQFDFWIGEWDLVSRFLLPDGKWTEEKGTDSVRAVLDGCALYQEWKGTVAGQPLHGISITSYTPRDRQWQQAWSDDSGPMLYVFTGGMEGDRMVLSRQVVADGKPVVRRQVFSNIRPDSLDWSYEQSTEAGGWTPIWTIRYTRKR